MEAQLPVGDLVLVDDEGCPETNHSYHSMLMPPQGDAACEL